MKKILTLTLLLTATLLLTGCGSNSTTSTTTISSTIKTQEISTLSTGVRSIEDVYYDVLDGGEYPSDMIEYSDTNISLTSYHSDTQDDVNAFAKKYKALTGKDAKILDGNYIVAKTGVKNDSSYEIQVRMVENKGSFTKVHVSVDVRLVVQIKYLESTTSV